VIKIYTTIPGGSLVSRAVGEDSIRFAAIHKPTGRPILARQPYVARTAGWRRGIEKKVKAIEAIIGERPLCPVCQQITVRRANRRTGDEFFGCVAYPECRGTAEE